ncbi:hypothetical protein ACFE04_020833 [Oxalis oulophora]
MNMKSCSDELRISDEFTVGGYKWLLLLSVEEDKLRIDMRISEEDCMTLPDGWSIDAGFICSILDQINGENTMELGSIEDVSQFSAEHIDWGYSTTVLLHQLNKPDQGYVVNDTLFVEAQVFVCNERAVLNQYAVDVAVTSSNKTSMKNRKIWICFDEMAMAMLEKLEDDKAPYSVRLGDFKEINSDKYVDVGIFRVPESLESYAKHLLEGHPDIGSGNSPVHYMNEMAFVVLCCALKSMDMKCFSEITESSIFKWRDAIRGATQFGFKVDFLKDKLKSVTQAYLSKLARNVDESKELSCLDERINAMEKELGTLKGHRSKLYNGMYSELRKSCENEEAKFSGTTKCLIFLQLAILQLILIYLLVCFSHVFDDMPLY